MMFLICVLIASAAALVLSIFDPAWRDLLLLAGPLCLASLLLLGARLRRRGDRGLVVVDGSNVMFWKNDAPCLSTVREVIRALEQRGLTPCVIFDANVGYKVGNRFMGDVVLARELQMPRNRVTVVPRGEPADPTVLRLARDGGGRVVSNDRFRDWHAEFPEAGRDGFVLRGGYRRGQLWVQDPG